MLYYTDYITYAILVLSYDLCFNGRRFFFKLIGFFRVFSEETLKISGWITL